MNEILFERWKSISRTNSSYIRIDSTHLYEWYLGYDENNSKSLLLISDLKPIESKSTKYIRLNVGKREDNKWAFTISLLNYDYEDVFLNLCSDLIDSSRNKEGDEGLLFIFKRYNQWIKLMESPKRIKLSDSEIKGLLGELVVMKELLEGETDLLLVLKSWMGPEGSDQDFIFEDFWIEVKSIGKSTSEVKISSLEQLRQDQTGILKIVNIDKTSPENKQAVSLANIFEEIKTMLSFNDNLLDLFLSKLMFNGYLELEQYSDDYFEIGEIANYRVNEGFPKLSRETVSNHITNVNYLLSRSSIAEWRF